MHLRLGTRASELALKQSMLVKAALEKLDPSLQIDLVHITTSGDKKQGSAAASQGDKKDWIYELELALLRNEIDLAVHSAKDVPVDIEHGTTLLPVLQRADPSDVFIGKLIPNTSQRLAFEKLAKGAKVGTASLRRKAQLLRIRPDLQICELRGNVPTRLRKLDEIEDLQGIVLAKAGLERLNLLPEQHHRFNPSELMPAVNQAIIAAQFRSAQSEISNLLAQLADDNLRSIWQAERSCVEVLGADCKSAVSIFANASTSTLTISARVLLPDGSKCLESASSAPCEQASQIGKLVGQDLIRQGALELLAQSRNVI